MVSKYIAKGKLSAKIGHKAKGPQTSKFEGSQLPIWLTISLKPLSIGRVVF